jgi:hypothetical protein
MLGTVDMPAGAILLSRNVTPLGGGDLAVRFGDHLVCLDLPLLGLKPPGFAACELTALHTLPDALLLMNLTLRNYRRLRLRHRSGSAQTQRQNHRTKYCPFHCLPSIVVESRCCASLLIDQGETANV